jgi:hypothetical protein
MAEPAKAKKALGDDYPITISDLKPDVTSCTCDLGDTITFTAKGQSCIVYFEGLPLGIPLNISNTVGEVVYANIADHIVHWGVEVWTPGKSRKNLGGGSTPYRIHIGSTDGGNT